MVEDQHQSAADSPADEVAPQGRLNRLVGRMLNWAAATRLRLVLTSVAGLVVLGVIFAAWSYLGQVALEPVDPKTADLALAAYDQGNYSEAKSLIGQMQKQPAPPEVLAKALFVLGAVKCVEAEGDGSPERRRAMYEIAARYLDKARSLGLADERVSMANYLLGKSLARSGQWSDAVSLLEAARRDVTLPVTEINSLLVEAILAQPEPDLPLALSYNAQVLADPQLPPTARDRALLVAAGAYLRLMKYPDARDALNRVNVDGELGASRMLLLGRIEIEEAQLLAAASPERAEKLKAASAYLEKVKGLESHGGDFTRQAALWTARCYDLRQEDAAALAEYERIVKEYPETSEGLTAGLAAADHYRRKGDIESALFGYRRVLREIGRKEGFDNPLMPQSEVRQRLLGVYQQCVEEEKFAEALTLVELFEPLFGRVSCADLRSKTHQQWGERLLDTAHTGDPVRDQPPLKEGRYHLRAAALDYEELAYLRFASRKFTDDLWNAADCYYRGQSFTNSARILREYLHHESQQRNPMALLRLGQSYLASGRTQEAIDAFSECDEMYPDDPYNYQARLECARAYVEIGKLPEAEQLLVGNLISQALTPASGEWRDSLFELGNLLFELGRFDEAIAKLDEAVKRYPDSRQSLLAKYTMARCYHAAAEAPAKRLAESKTENERQTARAVLTEQLTKAHEFYQQVQREITLRDLSGGDPLDRVLLRNCYLMQGSVLVELRRFDDAIVAFGSVITSYQNDPVALESFVQVAGCWRRLDQPVKARVWLDQAKMVLKGMPAETDFLASTNFNRQQWEMLLTQMGNW